MFEKREEKRREKRSRIRYFSKVTISGVLFSVSFFFFLKPSLDGRGLLGDQQQRRTCQASPPPPRHPAHTLEHENDSNKQNKMALVLFSKIGFQKGKPREGGHHPPRRRSGECGRGHPPIGALFDFDLPRFLFRDNLVSRSNPPPCDTHQRHRWSIKSWRPVRNCKIGT